MAALTYEMRKLIGNLTQDVIKEYGISIPIKDIETVVVALGGTVRRTVI